MKLSLTRKLGLLHVRGGEVRRVVERHHVFTRTLSSVEQVPDRGKPVPPRFPCGEKLVNAKPGDLAVEILKAKTGELVGYTYLSGDAIQLNAYLGDGPVAPSCFGEPANVRWLDFPRPPDLLAPTLEQQNAYVQGVFGFLMDAKYGLADLAMFGVAWADDAEALRCAEGLLTMLGYAHEPAEGETRQVQRAHVIAEVRGPKRRATIHGQPAGFEQPWCATRFQIGLVISTTRKPAGTMSDAAAVGGQPLRP